MLNFKYLNFLIKCFFVFSIHILNAQSSNCFEINGSNHKLCNLEVLYHSNDTIYCITRKECNEIDYDKKLNATYVTYYEDSTTVFEILSFKNQKNNNNHSVFYSNSSLKSQCNYENGILNGPYISFYENGLIKWAGIYINDSFLGSIYEYWNNGKVAHVSVFTEKNRFRGLSIYYNPNGVSILKEEFDEMWYCD